MLGAFEIEIFRKELTMHLHVNLGIDTLQETSLNLEELLIIAIIFSYEKNNKPCLLKREKMAQYIGVSVAKIERLYKDLKDKKYLFITQKTKKLTQKAITLCLKYFTYNVSSKNKKKLREPSWYARYQEQLQAQREQEKAISEQSKMSSSDMQEIARNIFGD